MSAVILVRHAMPEIRRGVASRLWRLGDAGREDCVLLAHHLPAELAPMVWTSDEPKANETASVIALRRGLDLRVDARLAEVDRPSTWDEDYRALAVRYLMGEELPGWEPRESVVVRFAAAIVDAAAGGDGRDFVVVDHGLAFSLYAASVVGSALDIAGFWRALAFPDAWRMDLDTGALTRLFVVGRPPEQFEAVRE